MTVSHKDAISFELVHIPVSLYTATQDNDIRFNQLHKDDHQRIRYKKVCGHCGKEVSTNDIVKGFEYDEGQYVVVMTVLGAWPIGETVPSLEIKDHYIKHLQDCACGEETPREFCSF